jgi:uncharacterized protein (UPF0332 family)
MSFDWQLFYELAENLQQNTDEASQRTAISRIYYAVYHRAKNLLETEGFNFRQFESSHRQVWNEYKFRGRTRRGIGIWGIRLHEMRVDADYFAEISDIEKLLEECFQTAKTINEYLAQIEKNTETQ